jgi:hypothetical protein
VAEALSAVEKERDALANELEQAGTTSSLRPSWPRRCCENELQKAAATKDAEIQG